MPVKSPQAKPFQSCHPTERCRTVSNGLTRRHQTHQWSRAHWTSLLYILLMITLLPVWVMAVTAFKNEIWPKNLQFIFRLHLTCCVALCQVRHYCTVFTQYLNLQQFETHCGFLCLISVHCNEHRHSWKLFCNGSTRSSVKTRRTSQPDISRVLSHNIV